MTAQYRWLSFLACAAAVACLHEAAKQSMSPPGPTAQVVNSDASYTHRWSVVGGTITSASPRTTVAYLAGAAGQPMVSCKGVKQAGVLGPAATVTVSVARLFRMQLR